MSITFDKVRALVQRAEVRISDHGYDEMSDENILAKEVLAGVFDGLVVEDYPTIWQRAMCACAAKRFQPAADPCGLGNSERFIVTGGGRDCVQI
jgi:hypothetical protein